MGSLGGYLNFRPIPVYNIGPVLVPSLPELRVCRRRPRISLACRVVNDVCSSHFVALCLCSRRTPLRRRHSPFPTASPSSPEGHNSGL
ncbi:hypothetical protein PIB30_056323 [Stylosanthes scabra]|uniref:Uncharacterized protein n=1 Tax=Stylosanthes scabra TaxID=79078 RepID=A0ABU6SJY7_9FABA|nr:hypothetical protein [Stylosanthes scabra]